MKNIELYQCDNCGLCCRSLLVEATELDLLREPRIEQEHPLKRKNQSLPVLGCTWILAAPGRGCAFLGLENKCQIYASRPNACVGFQAGGKQCVELREHAGLPKLEMTRVPATLMNRLAGEVQAVLDEEWG